MSDIERVMREAAGKSATLRERLTEIFMEHYGLNVTTENTPDAGYMAYGTLAVDVAVRLANVFLAVKADKGVWTVACDLSFQLSTNEFWQKNAAVLVPIMHVCLNTHNDGVMLQVERETRNEYSSHDALISASRAAPLEIFPVIAYLLGGPALMLSASLPLKRDLAPYFLS